MQTTGYVGRICCCNANIGSKMLKGLTRMFKLSRSILFVCAFLPLAEQAFARDERSIKDLSKALAGLASDVDPNEAELVSVTAHTTARKLARDYHVVL